MTWRALAKRRFFGKPPRVYGQTPKGVWATWAGGSLCVFLIFFVFWVEFVFVFFLKRKIVKFLMMRGGSVTCNVC